MKLTIRDETVYLLPEKALYWPREKMIVVADLHLGKAATFRSLGIPIPEGCMQADLAKLRLILEKYEAKTCVVAGDLIHAKRGLSESTIDIFSSWLKTINTEIHLVIGNHDHALKKNLPEGWNLIVHADEYNIQPFIFTHLPNPDSQAFVWSGHIHPFISIPFLRKSYKMPCFVLNEEVGILPAFTEFAAGHTLRRTKNNLYYPIIGNEVKLLNF